MTLLRTFLFRRSLPAPGAAFVHLVRLEAAGQFARRCRRGAGSDRFVLIPPARRKKYFLAAARAASSTHRPVLRSVAKSPSPRT